MKFPFQILKSSKKLLRTKKKRRFKAKVRPSLRRRMVLRRTRGNRRKYFKANVVIRKFQYRFKVFLLSFFL